MEMAFYRTGDYHFNYNLVMSCDASNDPACTIFRLFYEKINSRVRIYHKFSVNDLNNRD